MEENTKLLSKEYYTVDDLSKYFGVSQDLIIHFVKNGTIKTINKGDRRMLIPKKDFNQGAKEMLEYLLSSPIDKKTMKNKIQNLLIALAILGGINHAAAQGTAFTYQGQLNDGGCPANGSYDLTFTLFNANTNGVAIAGPVTNSAVLVTNGLFTVTIDFGAGVFNGQTNWLQIGVETNGGGSFTTLTPLQELTPTPYAIYSANAGNAVTAATAATAGAGEDVHGEDLLEEIGPGDAVGAGRQVALPRRVADGGRRRGRRIGRGRRSRWRWPERQGTTRARAVPSGAKAPW